MNKLLRFFLLSILLAPNLCQGQANQNQDSNSGFSPAEFRKLAAGCAPSIPLVTLRAIVHTESGFRPYALSLDYPHRTAREQGLTNGQILLARQPRTLTEARIWADWFLKHHHSVSIGLAQISTQHVRSLGLTADQLFDPCINMQAAARLLTAKYREAAARLGEGQAALYLALSEYNSGSSVIGFENGYVSAVINEQFYSAPHAENSSQHFALDKHEP
jgi:type IV secretion system protein VirB1